MSPKRLRLVVKSTTFNVRSDEEGPVRTRSLPPELDTAGRGAPQRPAKCQAHRQPEYVFDGHGWEKVVKEAISGQPLADAAKPSPHEWREGAEAQRSRDAPSEESTSSEWAPSEESLGSSGAGIDVGVWPEGRRGGKAGGVGRSGPKGSVTKVPRPAHRPGQVAKGFPTTVMLRNLPWKFSRARLVGLLNSTGFAGRYDFVYLPMQFSSRSSLGFAFVNLVTHEDADAMRGRFEGLRVSPACRCTAGWGGSGQQGLAANIERYRNSSVMHSDVPDEFKPAVFMHGSRVPFPHSTRSIRPPREGHIPGGAGPRQ